MSNLKSIMVILLVGHIFFAGFSPKDNPIIAQEECHEWTSLGLKGSTELVEWNSTGDKLAVGGSQGVWIYNENLELIKHVGDTSKIERMAWHPDGNQIATYNYDSSDFANSIQLQVWDVKENTLLYRLPAKFSVINLKWSPNGKLLASVLEYRIEVWDVQTTQVITLNTEASFRISWSPQSDFLAATSDNGVEVWNIHTETLTTTLSEGGKILDVAWQPDGTLIVGMNYAEGKLYVWNTQDYSLNKSFTIKGRGFIAWHPKNKLQITMLGYADSIQVWNTDTGNVEYTLETGSHFVFAYSWHPDGERIAISSEEFHVSIWSIYNDKPIVTLDGHNWQINDFDWSSDGTQIAIAESSFIYSAIQIWDVNEAKINLNFEIPIEWILRSNGISTVDWSPDGSYLATAYGIDIVHLWKITENQLSSPLLIQTSEQVLDIQWHPNSKYLLTLSRSYDVSKFNAISLWDVSTGDIVAQDQYADVVRGLAYSPDGKFIAQLNSDYSLLIRNGNSLEVLQTIDLTFSHDHDIYGLGNWNQNSSLVAFAIGVSRVSGESKVAIWNSQDQSLYITEVSFFAIASIEWHPTQNLLLVGSWYGETSIWDFETDSIVATLAGENHFSKWNPVSGTIATLDNNRAEIRLWDGCLPD